MDNKGKLELIAEKKLSVNEELYQLINFLNKNLKDKNLIFGLSKINEKTMVIKIYET
ncbi:MAG: hypothetical protein PWQ82_1756 [Thermosediminibacterales bacterium]|nr:hypothetical protein [Thermosediminibacterales bacterium]MDK2835988.1 hypothetical protein [Thermosediminibacterales bacterium]